MGAMEAALAEAGPDGLGQVWFDSESVCAPVAPAEPSKGPALRQAKPLVPAEEPPRQLFVMPERPSFSYVSPALRACEETLTVTACRHYEVRFPGARTRGEAVHALDALGMGCRTRRARACSG